MGGPKGAGRPGDAYDMPDGFDATGVAGGSTSMHASTNAAAGNGGYEMPVSVQAGQGSHDDGAYDEVKPYDEIDSAAPYCTMRLLTRTPKWTSLTTRLVKMKLNFEKS